MISRQSDQDALSVARVDKRIGAVLDELEQLPVGIAPVRRVVLVVGVLRNEMRLPARRHRRSSRSLDR